MSNLLESSLGIFFINWNAVYQRAYTRKKKQRLLCRKDYRAHSLRGQLTVTAAGNKMDLSRFKLLTEENISHHTKAVQQNLQQGSGVTTRNAAKRQKLTDSSGDTRGG